MLCEYDSCTSLSPMASTSVIDDAIKDKQFFLDDGDFVMISSDNVAFCPHRGCLVYRSAVFKDMFEANSREHQDVLFGRPVLQFEDESADDIRILLRTVYNDWLCETFQSTPIPLGQVVTLARLADKFQMADLRELIGKCVLLRFAIEMPLWMEEVATWVRLGHRYQFHDVVEAGILRMQRLWLDNPYSLQYLERQPMYPYEADVSEDTWFPRRDSWLVSKHEAVLQIQTVDAIVAVNVARLIGAESVLRPAFYMCTLLSPDRLAQGCQFVDGTYEKLSDGDFRRCLKAKAMASDPASLVSLCSKLSGKCRRRGACFSILDYILSQQSRNCEVLARYDWVELIGNETPLKPACGPCRAAIEEHATQQGERYWKILAQVLSSDSPSR